MVTEPIPEDDPDRSRVRDVLSTELERVTTPEQADAIVRRMKELAAGDSTGQATDAAAVVAEVVSPSATVEQAAAAADATNDAVAASLATTAAQQLAPTPAAPAVAVGAADALGVEDTSRSDAARQGRRLLRDAVLREMGPVQAIDARLFLTINRLPHTDTLNRMADTITQSTTGGWIWLAGLLAGKLLGADNARASLWVAAPVILGSTFVIEHPIKKTFRRRRPFIDVVHALVVGRRPDGWSFPSGHTGAAFAGALMLSHVWPKCSPLFMLGACTVGFSRVYVGAHYPGDVMSGATLGLTLAEAIRLGLVHLGIGRRATKGLGRFRPGA